MWLVKWSGSVLFDGLLQYGCSVLGSAPMVAAERQCRARQAGTAAEQHARRAADSLASKGRRKVLRAQPQQCRADVEAAVESTDQARKVFNGLFWMALFFLITHRLAALLWFRWPAWRCNSCTVSDPALVNGMSPEPLIPTGVLAVGQNAGHQVLVKVLCGWRGTTGHFEWQQARQPQAVYAGSNANKLLRPTCLALAGPILCRVCV